MSEPTGSQGNWTVYADDDSVFIEFTEIDTEGVIAYKTGMPRRNAIEFAAAVLSWAVEPPCTCDDDQ